MNLEKESALLTLIFADDTVQYRDRILPTGSIACMAMNIPKEALEKSLPLCQRIAAVNTMLHTRSFPTMKIPVDSFPVKSVIAIEQLWCMELFI